MIVPPFLVHCAAVSTPGTASWLKGRCDNLNDGITRYAGPPKAAASTNPLPTADVPCSRDLRGSVATCGNCVLGTKHTAIEACRPPEQELGTTSWRLLLQMGGNWRVWPFAGAPHLSNLSRGLLVKLDKLSVRSPGPQSVPAVELCGE